ncbi:MAG: exodeoxyribonuclease V subunit gamma [Pirellulales bacterium]|nr:exodeoxyribonuclease V subunit gamma [Pirellulales bacterium]
MPSARVAVIAGLPRSGKTELLLSRYRSRLAELPVGSCLWLSPSQRSSDVVRQGLLGQGQRAMLAPGILTFDQFAQQIVAASGEPVRRISPTMKRHLLRRSVDTLHAAGRLPVLGPIAATPGLVEELAHWIAELKRHEIWPEDFAGAIEQAKLGPKERELWALYDCYQSLLLEHRLYDAEGQFWLARKLIAEGSRAPFSSIKHLVVDGFSDLTRPQHEILALLAGQLDELWISLPWDSDSQVPRPELFRKTSATLAELRRRHKSLVVHEQRRSTAAWPALQAIVAELFADPRRGAVDVAPEGIEVLAAGRPLREIERVARKIKELLLGGTRPGEIAVVFRRLPEAAPLVREVFAEYGIPTAIETGRPLRDAPLLAAVTALLRLAVEDWSFAGMLTAIGNSYFQPQQAQLDAMRASAEWIVRDFQLPRGRKRLGERLARLAAQAAPQNASPDDHQARQRGHARRAMAYFGWLGRLLDTLPAEATLEAWCDTLSQLIDGTLAVGHEASLAPPQLEPIDRRAWARLSETLRTLGQLRDQVDPEGRVSCAGILQAIADIASHEQLPADHDETGRVRVLSAASVRALAVPHLFVAGLTERSFPAPLRENHLCGQREHRRLIDAGLPLAPHAEYASEEMLLFYEVVTRATRRLYLSYPAWDESGQPLLPSPYVEEVRRVFGSERLVPTDAPDLSPLPGADETAYGPAEWRLRGAVDALDGKSDGLHQLVAATASRPMALNVLAAWTAIDERRDIERFSAFEGILSTPAAREACAARFGPAYTWSATELELLAACPYKFLAERLLGLDEMPALVLETDYRRRGVVVHEVLAQLHRRINDEFPGPAALAQAGIEQVHAWIGELLAADAQEHDPEFGYEAMLRLIDRERLARDLAAYPQEHQAYEKELQTAVQAAHFEISFGLDPPSSDPRSTTQPLELATAAGVIKLAGRIDRVDLLTAARRTLASVIDYKTGSLPAKKLAEVIKRDVLQLPIYARAVEEVLLVEQQVQAGSIGFWRPTGNKDRGYHRVAELSADGEPREEWQTLQSWIAERVGQLVLAARAGQFPVYARDPECTRHCGFHTICRVSHVRALEKTWTPPDGPPA